MVFERSFIDTWLQGKLAIYDQRFSFLYFYIAWFTSPKSFESFLSIIDSFFKMIASFWFLIDCIISLRTFLMIDDW